MADTKWTKADGSVYAAAGVSIVKEGLLGWAQTEAYKDKLDADTKSYISTLRAEMRSYESQMGVFKGQEVELQQQLQGRISQRALEGLKAESRLRAAAAETGASGGSIEAAIRQADMDTMMDSARIKADAMHKKSDLLRRRDMLNVSLQNKLSGLSPEVRGPSEAMGWVSGLSSGLNVYMGTYSMLGEEQRASLFGSSAGNVGRNDIKPLEES